MVQGMLKRILTKYEHEGLTPEEIEHLNTIKGQNPYGMLTLLLGLISFLFGPQYIIIPIVALLFGFITYRTFDYEKEDNPWTFYIGLLFAFIGLILNFLHYVHVLG